MAEWNELVPAYQIADLAREALNKAKKATEKLRDHYQSKGKTVESMRQALKEIEPEQEFERRNARGLANMARQSQWGGVAVTKEDLHHLVPDDESKQ